MPTCRTARQQRTSCWPAPTTSEVNVTDLQRPQRSHGCTHSVLYCYRPHREPNGRQRVRHVRHAESQQRSQQWRGVRWAEQNPKPQSCFNIRKHLHSFKGSLRIETWINVLLKLEYSKLATIKVHFFSWGLEEISLGPAEMFRKNR